jgi:hypothetical protein
MSHCFSGIDLFTFADSCCINRYFRSVRHVNASVEPVVAIGHVTRTAFNLPIDGEQSNRYEIDQISSLDASCSSSVSEITLFSCSSSTPTYAFLLVLLKFPIHISKKCDFGLNSNTLLIDHQ